MKTAEGITESIKAENQMEWVRRMNNIRNRAEGIIRAEMIYNWSVSRGGTKFGAAFLFISKQYEVCGRQIYSKW